jgi:hypothetical protein
MIKRKEKKISKKKTMPTRVNPSSPWPESFDQKQ